MTTSWVSLLPVGQNGSKSPKFGHFWGVFPSQITTSRVYHLSLVKMGPKNPKLGTFEVCFPPKPHTLVLPTPPVGSTFFHWPKWIKKTPNWGTFEVCFPPKPHTLDLPTQLVGSTIFHWPKWVQNPQIGALLRGVFPRNTTSWVSLLPVGQNGSKNPKIGHFWGVFPPQSPPTRLGTAMRTAWVGAAPFNPIMGLGGVSILCPPPQYIPYIPYIPNPKPEDFGDILGVILRVFCPGMNSGFNLN